VITLVVESGIAAIAMEPDTMIAVTAAPARAEVKERIRALSRDREP